MTFEQRNYDMFAVQMWTISSSSHIIILFPAAGQKTDHPIQSRAKTLSRAATARLCHLPTSGSKPLSDCSAIVKKIKTLVHEVFHTTTKVPFIHPLCIGPHMTTAYNPTT